MDQIEIIPYSDVWEDETLALSRAAWTSVFDQMQRALPPFVWNAFYPQGWEARQDADIVAILGLRDAETWRACLDGRLAGFAGILLHPEDNMGEIHVIAVYPDFQNRGIGQQLMAHSEAQIAVAGMAMAFVETGGDPGHAPARAFYMAAGYEHVPVARYFKALGPTEGKD